MQRMIEGGPDITAVHNHLLRANPPTFYVHIGGHGDVINLATTIRPASMGKRHAISAARDQQSCACHRSRYAQLDQIIGVKGQANGGVYQVGVPRRDPVTMSGMPVASAGQMGLATGIGFQPTGGGKAAITGDFVMTSDEANPVIRELRAGDIEITALHSHMLDEQPRCSSCISGRTTTRSNWRKVCAPGSTRWPTPNPEWSAYWRRRAPNAIVEKRTPR